MSSTELWTGGPVFFKRNRVFRVYKGGKLFHNFFGDDAQDGNLPEEWIASTVGALNRDSSDPTEGLSRVAGSEVLFKDLLAAQPQQMLGDRKDLGILVKVLDSAIRLPVQAHPDKAFSQKHFNSTNGKTESWLVLATRENACLYFGFNQQVTPEQFKAAVEQSETDPDAMESLITRVDAHAGDLWLIPARVVHAIGYGCLILEVQEPTDFTIQPEAWCGDYHLNDYEKYLGLDVDTAMGCFDFTLWGDQAVRLGRKKPTVYHQDGQVCSEVLIGAGDTDCFAIRRHTVTGAMALQQAPSVLIVTQGAGEILWQGGSAQLAQGSYFFLPAAAKGECSVRAVKGGTLQLVECLPPNM